MGENDCGFVLKTAKGTRDWSPLQMVIREGVLGKISTVFKRHGCEAIDTPVFELRDTLTNKYGEDSKLIYDLADQGGERLSLRYDLTVPFARYLALNKVSTMKRFHIGKVYRRDNPAMTKGRYREFYQCDLDIAGAYDVMLPDAEVLAVMHQVYSQLDVGRFVIKVNHRQLLDEIMSISGVPQLKFRSVCSSIDKLDKLPWQRVREELINDRQVSEETVEKLGTFLLGGSSTSLEQLADDLCIGLENQAVSELKLLFDYCQSMGIDDNIVFDPCLARGLDYYTGPIFEAVLVDSEDVGSIGGGGRYDNLVGMFDANHRQVPCVGFSVGVERIFAILERKLAKLPRTTETQVLVASAERDLVGERLKLTAELWRAGISAEYPYQKNPKFLNQVQHCETARIPFMVVLGSREMQQGTVTLRDVKTRQDRVIRRSELIDTIQKELPGQN